MLNFFPNSTNEFSCQLIVPIVKDGDVIEAGARLTEGSLDPHDIIRINGEDDSIFVKDPLRFLRAIRLSAEYGMRIDKQTQEYMFDNKDLLDSFYRGLVGEHSVDELHEEEIYFDCMYVREEKREEGFAHLK